MTQYDALLLVVATQILQMVQQLTPLVRFDGYHVLADVTGVPDLFHRIKPTLLGMLPWRWRHPDATVLKPWARAVVSLWVVVVVPMLAFSLFTMVATLPRIVGSAATSADEQSTMLGRAWGDGDFLEVAARGVAIVAVVFPVLAIGVILFRLGRTAVVKTLQRTKGKPARRGVAGLLAAALVAGLAFLWWPHPGTYRPIQAWEGGTLAQAVPALRPATSDRLGRRPARHDHHRMERQGRAPDRREARAGRRCWCPGTGRARTPSHGCSRSTSRSSPARVTTRPWR